MIMLTIKPSQGGCLVWRAFGGCVIAAFMIFSVSAVYARENEPRYDLHISQAKLGDALNELARQMGVQLLFPFDLVQTREANPVSGQYTVTEALDILLRGTGFSGGLTESGVITVSQSPPVDRQNQEDAMLLKGKKRSLLSSVSALIVGVFGTADVNAQDTQGVNEIRGVPEIVVTTRKREENLQRVPIAITAFTARDIQDAGVQDIGDIALMTPGFTMAPLFGGGASTPVIRGLSTNIGEPNVGFFVDGVYQSSRAAMEAVIDNVERIEIAKGPQSALYGRNTFGGAINYITKKPSNEFEAVFEATAGSDERFDIKGTASGPIVEDRLYLQAGVTHFERDGYYTNELIGKGLDTKNTEVYHAALRAMPTEALDATFRIAFENTNDGDDSQRFVLNNAFPAILIPIPGVPPANQLYIGELPGYKNGFAVTPGYMQRDNLVTSLALDWDIGEYTLTSITGYNDLEVNALVDDDYDARVIHATNSETDLQEFSQELRITSPDSDRFRWLLGGFYYDLKEKTGIDSQFIGPAGVAMATILGPFQNLVNDTTQKTTSYAIFGEANFDITDQLTFSFAGRYTHEKKSATAIDFDPVFSGLIGMHVGGTFRDSAKFDNFTPRLTLNYQITEDHMVYASAARAVKVGGFNVVTAAGAILDSERTYDPEKSWHYEIGAKTSWFDGRLNLNIDGFYIQWNDQIVRGLGSTFAVLNINTGETTSKGIEVEMVANPVEGLDIRGGFAFTDAEYEDYDFTTLLLVGITDTQLAGKPLQNVSKYTANGSIQYRTPVMGEIDWFGRADIAYQAKQSSVQTADAFIGDATTVNFRTGLQTERVSLTFFVDNVLDEDAAAAGVFITNHARRFDFVNGLLGGGPITGFDAFGGLATARAPRTWGATVRASF